MPKNEKIQYGPKRLTRDEDFLPRNIKERISIMLDLDVLDEFRDRAKRGGGRYQTLINEALRGVLFGSSSPAPSKSLETRVERLEALVARVAGGGLRAEEVGQKGRKSRRT